MKKRIWIPLFLLLFTLAVIGWILWGNTALQVSRYTVESKDLPESFDGFRIAHVSDLHNAEFGQDNKKLLSLIAENEPDIIVITGDLIDSRRTDIDVALTFIREALKIAPCYYITGNHESRVAAYYRMEVEMREAGVTVLRNYKASINRDGESIHILGLDDRTFSGSAKFTQNLDALAGNEHGFTLLLTHRPEVFPLYCFYPIDLVLCGHTHGGQIRLPWLGAVFCPNQGWFPEYDAGLYHQRNTTMIISRGLGNSLFPFRVNNRPELVMVTLKTASQ